MFLWCLSDSLASLFHSLLFLWGPSIIKIVFPLFWWAWNKIRQTRDFLLSESSPFQKNIFLLLSIGFCSTATIIINRPEKFLQTFWCQHPVFIFRILYYHFIFLVFHTFFFFYEKSKIQSYYWNSSLVLHFLLCTLIYLKTC